ncbi:MAG: hypothetical protein ABIN48_03495 [Ginsengibacter sp.]
MKYKLKNTIYLFFSLIVFSSCESEAEIKQRTAIEEQQRIELVAQNKKEAEEREYRVEQERVIKEKREEEERIEREEKLEKERKEQEIYNRYINNSLSTGATPYYYCFGDNNSCNDYGCSAIKVKTPANSDVVVTIKRNGEVYRHAYIKAGSQYTMQFPDGIYQAFFYYGKGWNPDKVMKETTCGLLEGGFIANEHFGKDSPQKLNNQVLTYELILQQNGNFSTSPSNPEEAF